MAIAGLRHWNTRRSPRTEPSSTAEAITARELDAALDVLRPLALPPACLTEVRGVTRGETREEDEEEEENADEADDVESDESDPLLNTEVISRCEDSPEGMIRLKLRAVLKMRLSI